MFKKISSILIFSLLFFVFLSVKPVFAMPFYIPDSEGGYPFSFWIGLGSDNLGGSAFDFGLVYEGFRLFNDNIHIVMEGSGNSIDGGGASVIYLNIKTNKYVRIYFANEFNTIKLGFGEVDIFEIGKLDFDFNGGIIYHENFGLYFECQAVYKFLPFSACFGKLDYHIMNGNGIGIIVLGLNIIP